MKRKLSISVLSAACILAAIGGTVVAGEIAAYAVPNPTALGDKR
jgi:hypothetical protein